MIVETCYMCDRVATSREHCPPRVFFPEFKDAGKDCRRDLVSVPSCDEHNTGRSHDDEYAAFVILSMSARTEGLALDQARTKMIRALRRKGGMRSRVLKNPRDARVGDEDGLAFDVDVTALQRVMEATTRGLHFKQFGIKLLTPLRVVMPAILRPGDDGLRYLSLMEMARRQQWDVGTGSANPDVFRFRFRCLPPSNIIAGPVFHYLFYRSFGVFVAPLPALT